VIKQKKYAADDWLINSYYYYWKQVSTQAQNFTGKIPGKNP
jgi:hypothetical protein